MAITFKSWINVVPPCFGVVEVAERKYGDPKWRRLRSSFLAFSFLIVMFMLFLCNVAINNPKLARTSAWGVSMFTQRPENCTNKPLSRKDGNAEAGGSFRAGNEVMQTQPKGGPKKVGSQATGTLRREGTETLPTGIVESLSDLELRHLWKVPEQVVQPPQNLVAMAVGIKQKANVDKIIQKFPAANFTVMLFHYDGKVDGWTDFEWSARAIHVMALNQTKWWFAKRFLHPDIVAKYNYLFLWDEDLGVKNFHAERYLAIMEDEGLEISQPALHRNSSEVHHRLTLLNPNARAHRRIYSYTGRNQCSALSTGPPCTGWVEMMAPVFSKAAWRCSWHIIQNDLVHAWGMDYKLGYCAQGIRSQKVGVIDSEFIVHKGIPSLGGPLLKKAQSVFDGDSISNQNGLLPTIGTEVDTRLEIRRRAGVELNIFSRRWRRAAANDENWVDPYKQPVVESFEISTEQKAPTKHPNQQPVVGSFENSTKQRASTKQEAKH